MLLSCGEAWWLGCGRGGPEEAGQLARDRDNRDVVVLAARFHRRVGVVQALLGTVGDLQDVIGLPFLAVGQGRADTRFAGVVPSGLDKEAAGELRSGLRDLTVPVALAGLLT